MIHAPICVCSIGKPFAHRLAAHDETGRCTVKGCHCTRPEQLTEAHLEGGGRATGPALRPPSEEPSPAEEELALHIKGSEIVPAPEREHRFHPTRKWEIDFAWPSRVTMSVCGEYPETHPLALEIEGMDHRKTQRYRTDLAKYNALALMGWTLIRFTPAEVRCGKALEWLEAIFSGADLVELAGRKK